MRRLLWKDSLLFNFQEDRACHTMQGHMGSPCVGRRQKGMRGKHGPETLLGFLQEGMDEAG